LTDDLVVEVMLNADGAVWVKVFRAGRRRTRVQMAAPTGAPRKPNQEGAHLSRLGSSAEALPALLAVGEAMAAAHVARRHRRKW
jgi:hypothetical protein